MLFISYKFTMSITKAPSILHDKKVLLVDATPDNLYLTQRYVQNMWVDKENITTAKDWSTAIEFAKKQLFDLIVTEISLPWMDGAELSQKIKEIALDKSPKMVAYTANQFAWNIAHIEELFDDIILKPADKETFEEKIREVFAREKIEN